MFVTFGNKLTRATSESAGYDIHAPYDFTVEPGKVVMIKTGIRMVIPRGYYGKIYERSSVCLKKKCIVLAGVIDSDYRDEIIVVLRNYSDDYIASFDKGDRFAQIILHKLFDGVHRHVNDEKELISNDSACGSIDSTDSIVIRTGGFGSTGK